MRPLPLLLMTCCISFVSPQIQASGADRLDTIERLFDLSDDPPPSSPDPEPLATPRTSLVLRRRAVPASLSWARPSFEPKPSPDLVRKTAPRLLPLPPPSPLRPRRHLSSRGAQHHHAQLMRVGCKLGTCQVQNLSHRLYQLIGQRGREDSSPINPRSPHSYG